MGGGGSDIAARTACTGQATQSTLILLAGRRAPRRGKGHPVGSEPLLISGIRPPFCTSFIDVPPHPSTPGNPPSPPPPNPPSTNVHPARITLAQLKTLNRRSDRALLSTTSHVPSSAPHRLQPCRAPLVRLAHSRRRIARGRQSEGCAERVDGRTNGLGRELITVLHGMKLTHSPNGTRRAHR